MGVFVRQRKRPGRRGTGAFSIFYGASTPLPPTAVIEYEADRTMVAPAMFVFSARNSTPNPTSLARIVRYEFTVGGTTYVRAGAEFGWDFTTAAAHDVTVVVEDALGQRSDPVTVTVTLAAFSGEVKYVTIAGNNANSGNDAANGWADLDYAKDATHWGSKVAYEPKKLMVERGFVQNKGASLLTMINSSWPCPLWLEAFGTGARPLITFDDTKAMTMSSLLTAGAEMKVTGIEIRSNAGPQVHGGLLSLGRPGCEVRDVVVVKGQIITVGNIWGTGFKDTTIKNGGENCIFLTGRDFVLIGIDGIEPGDSDILDHFFYGSEHDTPVGGKRGYIGDCYYDGGTLNNNSAYKLRCVKDTTIYGCEIYRARNAILWSSDDRAAAVTAGETITENVTFERGWIHECGKTNQASAILLGWQRGGLVVNTRFDATKSGEASQGQIVYSLLENDPYDPCDFRVYGCTFFNHVAPILQFQKEPEPGTLITLQGNVIQHTAATTYGYFRLNLASRVSLIASDWNQWYGQAADGSDILTSGDAAAGVDTTRVEWQGLGQDVNSNFTDNPNLGASTEPTDLAAVAHSIPELFNDYAGAARTNVLTQLKLGAVFA